MSAKYLSSITTQDITAAGNILVDRAGSGSGAGVAWNLAVQNAGATDALQLGCTSSAYTTGGTLPWAGNSQTYLYYPATFKIGTGGGSTATLALDASLNATFGGTITGNGSGLTTLVASNLASGTVPTARLASGTASSGTALRGDQTWGMTPETLYIETVSTAVINTTTATVLTSGTGLGSLTLPANFFTAGRTIRITAGGVYSTDSVAPNISMYLRFGGTTIGQLGAQLAVANLSTRRWSIQFTIRCTTPGSSAVFVGQGTGTLNTSATAGTVSEVAVSSGPVADTTTTQSVNLAWQWGTASTNNNASLLQFILESLN